MNSVTHEYRTVAGGAGWIDRRARGRLRLLGRDAGSFLHALVTNDVKGLGIGSGVYAAYLTPQGRMIADLTIYNRGRDLLVDVAPGVAAPLSERLDRLIFTEDVQVSDASEALARMTVAGDAAAATVEQAFSSGAMRPDGLATLPVLGHVDVGDTTIVHSDEMRLPSYEIFVPADAFESVRARLESQGAVPMSDALVEGLRIEAGRPSFGIDMDEETIPLEAGLLERAVSTTKGCYVGQEIIIRILHRGGGRVAKRLARLVFDPEVADPPARGAAIFDGDREVGRITSTAISPTTGRVIALGYVHRDMPEEGKALSVRAGERDCGVTISGFAG